MRVCRVVRAFLGARAFVRYLNFAARQMLDELLFQAVARVITANCYSHASKIAELPMIEHPACS